MIMESICGEGSEVVQCAHTESQSCYNVTHTSTKRNKELENVALQSSLNCLRTELQTVAVSETKGGRETEVEEDAGPGVFFQPEPGAPPHAVRPQAESDTFTGETKIHAEERTLTDHLNKRLLCSFLEKLNERESAPGVHRGVDHAADGEGDSNRAVDEW
ncbi:hypothetical protein Z043_123246 [Scleropages formosus]|uniref:Uncharacterized protein n=1 Tax=Scleropages formosus TaxID=113540 RepID=A0A0P7TMG1_SCLFO|nr:hypothetical protein Z043_123246 [Scleropages formosus]